VARPRSRSMALQARRLVPGSNPAGRPRADPWREPACTPGREPGARTSLYSTARTRGANQLVLHGAIQRVLRGAHRLAGTPLGVPVPSRAQPDTTSGCKAMMLNIAPVGSVTTAKRPGSMSIGGITIWPPSRTTSSTALSASSTAK